MSEYKYDDKMVPQERSCPRLYLTPDDLPAIEKWEVGRKYKVLVEMKQVEKHESDDAAMGATFEVTKMKELPIESNFSKDDIKVALNMEKLEYLR